MFKKNTKKKRKINDHKTEDINLTDTDDEEEIDNEALEELIKEPLNISRNIYLPRNKLFKPIGILDPEGKELNPLTKKEYQNLYINDSQLGTYKDMADNFWTKLPMYQKQIRVNAIQEIYDNQVILIISGTGSGKTVLTPKYVLHVLNYEGRIAITNPKRIPSNDNAIFASKNLDVKLGEEVGLKYRNSKKFQYSPEKSKLIYCTDGYILGRLKTNPLLPDLDCVIIDEAHERGVNIDLLLLKLKRLVLLRPDFKLVIMSATISQDIFKAYFPSNKFKFAIVNGGQETFQPVKEYFLDEIPFLKSKIIYQTNGKKSILNKTGELKIPDDKLYLDPTIDIIIYILRNKIEGDILAFVGGKGSGNKGVEILKNRLNNEDEEIKNSIYIGVLSSSTEAKTSDLITHETKYKDENPTLSRKIIFATEVAESSVTIKGLKIVIDSGIVHSSRYYVESNLDALEKRFIPKSSHKQRKGRVGRTSPGICYNLFTKEQYNKLFNEYAVAPIYSDNISSFILDFICQDINLIHFPFKYPKYNKSTDSKLFSNDQYNSELDLSELLYELIEPPLSDTVSKTLRRLYNLDCINISDNKGYSSQVGRCISNIGLNPELGRLLISGYNFNCRDQICWFINFYEYFECKFEKIFLSLDNLKIRYLKDKNKEEITDKETQNLSFKYYDKVKSFSSKYGDIISFINIIQQYLDQKNRFLENKISQDNLDKWIEEHYLSKKNIDKILKRKKRDYSNRLKDFINFELDQKRDLKIKKSDLFKYLKNIYLISENSEENLLNSILESLLINISHQSNKKGNFFSCFPEIPLEGKIPDNRYGLSTFLNYPIRDIKNLESFMIYFSFKSIFGNRNFNMVNLIPKSILEVLIYRFKQNPENLFFKKQYSILLECTQIMNKINIEKEKQKEIDKIKDKTIKKEINKNTKISRKLSKMKLKKLETKKNKPRYNYIKR